MTWVPHPARPILHCRLRVFLEIVYEHLQRKPTKTISYSQFWPACKLRNLIES
jgi:hypothetical protein